MTIAKEFYTSAILCAVCTEVWLTHHRPPSLYPVDPPFRHQTHLVTEN